MSLIARLIAEMESRGIILSLAGGEIRYRSPKDALTAADRESLRAGRADLIGWLGARDAGRALRGIKGTQGPLITSVAQEMWWRSSVRYRGSSSINIKRISVRLQHA